MSQANLVKFLQTKIAEYLEEKRHHSLMTLSDRSGVPYNTIRRIANGQVDKPTLETVLAVLRVVENRQGVVESVRQFYPDLGDLFSTTTEASETQMLTDNTIDSMMSDQINYRIFRLLERALAYAARKFAKCSETMGFKKPNPCLRWVFSSKTTPKPSTR